MTALELWLNYTVLLCQMRFLRLLLCIILVQMLIVTLHTIFSFPTYTFDVSEQDSSCLSPCHGLLKPEKRMFGSPNQVGIFSKTVKAVFNQVLRVYECNLCWIFPVKTVYYELRVVKLVIEELSLRRLSLSQRNIQSPKACQSLEWRMSVFWKTIVSL